MSDIQQLPFEAEEEVKSLEESLEDIWGLLRRRWPILLLVVMLVVGFRMYQVYKKKPLFVAKGTLLIEQEMNFLNLPGMYPYGGSDWRNEYLNTQIKILRSRSLARSVIADLRLLDETATREQTTFTPGEDTADQAAAGDASSGDSLSGAISGFLGGLMIEPVENTRLVEISYISPSAEYSARAVNTLFDQYIRFNLQLKTESTKMASEFLYEQIESLRKTLSQKERELQEYGKRKELFYLSNQDSTVVEKFGDLNKAYTEAQIDRINKESNFRELKDKRFGDYPEVRTAGLILSLKQEYARLESEYQRKSQIFKEDYPEMQRLRSQLETTQARINEETADIGRKALKGAEADYQAALKREESLAAMLNTQKGEVISTNTDAIYYNSLKIEVNNMRQLLDHLVRKQKESLLTSRLEGLQTSNIKVIDPAEVPLHPIGSSQSREFFMALIIGLFGGGALIFFIDWLDKTLKTPEEAQKLLRVPAIGLIPALGTGSEKQYYASSYYGGRRKDAKARVSKIELANFVDPESGIAESYRNIRTSILLSTADGPPQVMTVSSALPKEGKTTTVVNLAVSFTKLNKRVLIIDADMRKPAIHKIFRVKNLSGLSSFLVGKAQVEDAFFETQVENLYVIPAGPTPPNPAELLESKKMGAMLEKMKEHFDFIFIDSPPLIGIVDPVIIGRYGQGTLLVAWGGKTHKKVIERAKDELEKFDIRVLGVIINNLNMKKTPGAGYYSYGTYKYRYRYREDSRTDRGRNLDLIAENGGRKPPAGERSINFRK